MTPRVAVITGASRGIGFETAKHLASQGWDLALCARDEALVGAVANAIQSEFAIRCVGFGVDVVDQTQMTKFANRSQELLGNAGVLICNAGVLGPLGKLTDINLDDFRATLDTNLFGVTNTICAFSNQLETLSSSRIIALSGGGLGGPNPINRAPAYTASKAALLMLAEAIAADLDSTTTTINCIAPGNIPTEFMNSAIQSGSAIAGKVNYDDAIRRQSIEIGDSLYSYFALLDYLVSPIADHINGRILSARWDDPEKLEAMRSDNLSPNLFRLRRIDEDLFGEQTNE